MAVTQTYYNKYIVAPPVLVTSFPSPINSLPC